MANAFPTTDLGGELDEPVRPFPGPTGAERTRTAALAKLEEKDLRRQAIPTCEAAAARCFANTAGRQLSGRRAAI
jgi:hypothetical protein